MFLWCNCDVVKNNQPDGGVSQSPLSPTNQYCDIASCCCLNVWVPERDAAYPMSSEDIHRADHAEHQQHSGEDADYADFCVVPVEINVEFLFAWKTLTKECPSVQEGFPTQYIFI